LTDIRTVRDVRDGVKEAVRGQATGQAGRPWWRVGGISRGIIESCQAHRYQVNRAAW